MAKADNITTDQVTITKDLATVACSSYTDVWYDARTGSFQEVKKHLSHLRTQQRLHSFTLHTVEKYNRVAAKKRKASHKHALCNFGRYACNRHLVITHEGENSKQEPIPCICDPKRKTTGDVKPTIQEIVTSWIARGGAQTLSYLAESGDPRSSCDHRRELGRACFEEHIDAPYQCADGALCVPDQAGYLKSNQSTTAEDTTTQAFPTDAAERKRDAKRAAKLAGTELKVVKQKKFVEDHHDDCGENISAIEESFLEVNDTERDTQIYFRTTRTTLALSSTHCLDLVLEEFHQCQLQSTYYPMFVRLLHMLNIYTVENHCSKLWIGWNYAAAPMAQVGYRCEPIPEYHRLICLLMCSLPMLMSNNEYRLIFRHIHQA